MCFKSEKWLVFVWLIQMWCLSLGWRPSSCTQHWCWRKGLWSTILVLRLCSSSQGARYDDGATFKMHSLYCFSCVAITSYHTSTIARLSSIGSGSDSFQCFVDICSLEFIQPCLGGGWKWHSNILFFPSLGDVQAKWVCVWSEAWNLGFFCASL